MHQSQKPDKSYFSLLNENATHQYKISLQSSSNITSNQLLEEAWQGSNKILNEDAIDDMLGSAKKLLTNSNSHNTLSWKSSISEMPDPLTVFERSLQCTKCPDLKNAHCTDFMKSDCRCKTPPLDVKSDQVNFESLQNSNQEIKEPFKPKFCNLKSKQASNKFIPIVNTKSKTNAMNDMDQSKSANSGTDVDMEDGEKANKKPLDTTSFKSAHQQLLVSNEEHPKRKDYTTNKEYDIEIDKSKFADQSTDKDVIDDEKTHKSQVAKIIFKTAKEQLLASNPAARRYLGASRKAQAKFVSPMLGMLDKQETNEPAVSDERLKHIDPKMIELIESEIIDKGTPICWDDIAGLQMAKSVIQEAVVWPLVRPDIFTGLRRPPRGILLFGPPGTGKTLIGKCVAAQCRATFFSISASSLTSKWIGDGEKMVRALFAVARCHQPAVIFIDEIDSLLTQRSDSEHEATRRIKTEFLVQFDGAATGEEDRLLIVGATNRPQELDEAARRRLVKRLYIPLPDIDARKQIISNLLRDENHDLSSQHTVEIAGLTDGYSGADMKSLCSEAAMGPIRSVPLSQIITIDRNKVRPVNVLDFKAALQRVRPSVSQDDLGVYVKWNSTYGQGF